MSSQFKERYFIANFFFSQIEIILATFFVRCGKEYRCFTYFAIFPNSTN